MSHWIEIFLGVIAISTLATAVVQIGVLVAARRLALRLERLADRVEREIAPLSSQARAVGHEAARTAALVTAQVERVDALFADVAMRLDQTMRTIQASVMIPAKESVAIIRGVQAALGAIRSRYPGRPRTGSEDDDALFI